jgi:L-threonylcarbamoyladenylate synthase
MTGPRTELITADSDGIARAARLITRGRLVAFPTETVYGLGADAGNDRAVAAVFEAKKRPSFNPLIVHFADIESARRVVAFDARADALAAEFWPGPLTLVLPRRAGGRLSLLVSAGLDTAAVRVPSHPVARALLQAADCPVAAPSANRSGSVSPTTAAHVLESLGGRIDAVLDGGRCAVGIESTVVDLSGAAAGLLRPGGVAHEEIEALIGPLARPETDPRAPRSPGLLERHYAPSARLRLGARTARPGELLLGFGPEAPAEAANLSPSGDLREAAANLFAMLRELDREDVAAIAVMPVPETGLGVAINDRLRRAAAPR